MKNKFRKLSLKLLLSFVLIASSMFVFIACSNDLTDLERELYALRNKVNYLQNNTQGPQGPAGNDGAQGPQGPAGNDGKDWTPTERIYQLGETFTKWHGSLRLFSVTLHRNDALSNPIRITILNYNMPGYSTSAFIRGRHMTTGGTFSTHNFSNNILSIGDSREYMDIDGAYFWFGTPTAVAANTMIPFVKFRLAP